MAEILQVENLHVEYETATGVVKALNGITLAQREEEIFCLVGESGSGKSTLAQAIIGILPSNAAIKRGSVVFNGVDLLQQPQSYLRGLRGKEIALVFQDARAALDPAQTIGQQLNEAIRIHAPLNSRQAQNMGEEMLRELGLPDPRRIWGQYPFNLSGGMCQRVTLAMALAHRPKLLIADEPTSNLDVTLQAEILERLRRLCRELHSAILLITHDMGIVAHLANRVGIMYAGMLAEAAEVLPIFREPRHPYTWALLQALPRLDAPRRRLTPLEGAPPDLTQLPEQCPYLPRCAKATSQCRVTPRPPLEEIAPRHQVACYNPITPVAD